MLYIFLSLVFFSIAWMRNYGLVIFFILALCLPIGNSFADQFYRYGLVTTDYYFISLLVRLAINFKVPLRMASASLAICLIYGLAAIGLGSDIDVYFLRDLRLLLYVLSMAALIGLQNEGAKITAPTVHLLAITAGLSCAIFTTAVFFELIVINDNYFLNNAFRFFTISSYFCFGYLAFNRFLPEASTRGILYYSAVLISILAVGLTGFRALTALAVMLYILNFQRSNRGLTVLLLSLVLIMPVLIVTQEGALLQRLLSLSPGLLLQNWESRLLPFTVKLKEMGNWELIFGSGFGSIFEIPWFAYREGKDVLNNFIDNLYLTLYIKFGFLSLLLLFEYFLIHINLLRARSLKEKIITLACLLCLWLFYSLTYQLAVSGFAIACFCIGSVRLSTPSGAAMEGGRAKPVTMPSARK